ncbi:3-oxoacyl-[acyl-carrier-protein] synthase III C-terminal domain-containing protein [Oceanobacillus massiliensis]|uniref:3-oxoacyl-[acyl-carrier-protein] synthase III C-terminal domain-containing protein n=1 Tax=Oceanobacillus massiliensis TaxID=1465765 RepID=UPI000288B8F1|nr:3-oxoacyl-[acyl-carrier-protein] synthase III C-terminal domain-containing protein [Oceanobacillus massiliensis]
MTHIRIKEIEIYHPNHVIEKQTTLDHFQKQDRDISRFIEAMGKKDRYTIDNEAENGLTMAINASKQVLEKAHMKGKDIDYIVYSTQVPERTFPTNSMYIHEAISAHSDALAIDTNANCAGMTVAIEQASRYMLSNPDIDTALIIGSDHLSLVSNPEQEITYATYGDAACAVVLEKTEEETGFIDAKYHTVTTHIDKISYPAEGLAKSLNGTADGRYINFEQFDASFGTPITVGLIEDILTRNKLTASDVSAFCISQFAYSDKTKIQDHFGMDQEKVIYIGDRYGYTGTSSPLIAFYEGIKDGRIKRGDHVLFWTVGAGHQFIAMLFKY